MDATKSTLRAASHARALALRLDVVIARLDAGDELRLALAILEQDVPAMLREIRAAANAAAEAITAALGPR